MLPLNERNGLDVFACICRAVTTDEVGAAIDNGAATVAAVAKATGACTRCGLCRDRIRGMLGEQSQPGPRVAAAAAAMPVSAG
jgi:bacterioferritin-associated ferredoxin